MSVSDDNENVIIVIICHNDDNDIYDDFVAIFYQF